jgi:anti-anti-sigma factor
VSPNAVEVDRSLPDVTVREVSGEHDVYSTQGLFEYLDRALDRGVGLVVDLTGATFLDSSVIAVLVSGRRRFVEAGLNFGVLLGRDAEPTMRRTFEVTGLMNLVPVFSDREQALAAARAPVT